MSRYPIAVIGTLLAAWHGGNALAQSGQGPAAPSTEICACVSGGIDSDAKAARCSGLLDAMAPEQIVDLTGRCNAQRAATGGPDLCFCLKTFHTDPKIIEACEAIIGKDTKPSEIARLGAQC